jgi:transitional endoplasmic reticulum ATPase
MSSNSDTIQALRQALSVSPENVPLRQHLADTLLGQGDPEAAEREYAQALNLEPQNLQVKLGLARAFFQQGKDSQALVLVEDVLKQGENSAATLTLHSRLLLKTGAVEKSVEQFRKALAQDETLKESDLVEQLGMNASNDAAVVEGRVRSQWEPSGLSIDKNIERPNLTFAEVGGMETVKEEIRLKIIYPIAHAEMYKAYGKAIGGGILMYGPPGCGKTHLARATAGEIQAGFIAVGLNDILDMWIGNSEKNLHDVFDQARRNSPCVLFFDEVDALAASRSDLRQSGGRNIINQFLSELDGVQYSNEGVLILAATNAPWHLDSAFRRPGRFDRILFVPPPDGPARAAILRLLCKGKPTENIDFEFLGKKTENLSGADLQALVDTAVEKKLQEAMKTGIPKPLTTKDLANAAGVIKPSTREWFGTARNYAIHANQDGTYDDILKYMNL